MAHLHADMERFDFHGEVCEIVIESATHRQDRFDRSAATRPSLQIAKVFVLYGRGSLA
jgi:hypothetical protein